MKDDDFLRQMEQGFCTYVSVLAEKMDNKSIQQEASLDRSTLPELTASSFSLWLFLLPPVIFLPTGDAALN